MIGVLVNPSSNSLPIIHLFNDIASFGIMIGIGLFSDSIHSIRSAFAPLELIFSSSSFFFIFIVHSVCVFPSFYSDLGSQENEEALKSLFNIPNEGFK